MSGTVVLMRHGKAEQPREGEADFDRQLTEHGVRALRATLPHALELLPSGPSVQIWTSPAARAEQTAQAVLQACRRAGVKAMPKVEHVDALWDQDFDAFCDLVRACPADIVLAVGHNPFIEDTVEALTASRIGFATGAFAAVELLPEQSPDIESSMAPEPSDQANNAAANAFANPLGRLLWFSQGPVSQRWKTLVHMERVLFEAAETVQKRRKTFFSKPDDPESMHKFRVSIRTLRSLLAFVAPWQQRTQNKTCQANLKRVVSETSRLRELDVLTIQASEMGGTTSELVAFCAAHAEAERNRVLKVLDTKHLIKLLEDTTRELSNVKWRACVEQRGLDASAVRTRFDALTAALEADLSTLDLADEEATHDVRKDAKRVRYDAERFKELLGADAVDIAKNMTAHQDGLGEVCDARANIGIISGFETGDLPEQVAWDLALLRAQNETLLYTTLRNRDTPVAG